MHIGVNLKYFGMIFLKIIPKSFFLVTIIYKFANQIC
jgi:hypothetical protein